MIATRTAASIARRVSTSIVRHVSVTVAARVSVATAEAFTSIASVRGMARRSAHRTPLATRVFVTRTRCVTGSARVARAIGAAWIARVRSRLPRLPGGFVRASALMNTASLLAGTATFVISRPAILCAGKHCCSQQQRQY